MALDGDKRQVFFNTFEKMKNQAKLDSFEKMISKIIRLHPETHSVLANPEVYANHEFEINEPDPFSHLALHAVVLEMINSDTPRGLRTIYDQRVRQTGDKHASQHDLMTAVFDWWMVAGNDEQQQYNEADFLNRIRTQFEIPAV